MIHPDRIRRARRSTTPQEEIDKLTRIYKALGDPTRLKIALALTEGEMCVCDLSAFLEVSESAVSHQLRRLKDLSLVRNRRNGRVLYYSLADQHVIDFLNIGLEHIRE